MLEIALIDEFYIFLFSINYGLLIGFIYDLYRVFRYYSKPKKILSLIEDLIFWLIVTLIFFMFLVKNTDGVIRGFVIVGFLIGSFLYFKIISKYIFSLLIKFFKLILELIHEIISIIVYPLKKVITFFKKGFRRIHRLMKGVFKDIKKYIKLTSKKK